MSDPVDLTLPAFDEEKHYAVWTDMLGREFRPGDVVAVGITAGRSASLTVGMVRRINKANSWGEPHTRTIHNPRGPNGRFTSRTVPSCTVTFVALLDSSNRLGRWSVRDSTVGPEKIVRLDASVAEVLASSARE